MMGYVGSRVVSDDSEGPRYGVWSATRAGASIVCRLRFYFIVIFVLLSAPAYSTVPGL